MNSAINYFRAEEKRIKKGSSVSEGDEVFEKWNKWLRKKAEEAMTALSKVPNILNQTLFPSVVMS